MKKIFLTIGTLLLLATTAYGYSMPRWGMTAVDVYIPENEYASVVKRAFNEWSQASNGRMRFRFNSTRFASNNAPIKVSFLEEKAPYYLTMAKRMETTGYFTNMEDGFINKATIKVYTKDRNDKSIDQQQLHRQLLADIGYILGLEKFYGDCSKLEKQTVMCMSPNDTLQKLTEYDIVQIQEKYTRSSDDIKEQKSKR